jgi:two-component system capsular synthesis response regulator RcsB
MNELSQSGISNGRNPLQQRMRVVVADDHPVILLGAEQALMKFPDIQVVGQARQSTELINVLQTVKCDVLVTDLAMPGGQYGDGLPLISYVLRHFPGLKIVVLTMLENAALLKRLGELGVIAVVNKSDDLAHIGLAIRHVMRTLHYASPSVRTALDTLRMNAGGKTDDVILSRRELEVVRLFVSGLTIKEISNHLNRSIKTISTQKNMAMRKLGVERDSELFQYAQSNGLMNLSSHLQVGLTGSAE